MKIVPLFVDIISTAEKHKRELSVALHNENPPLRASITEKITANTFLSPTLYVYNRNLIFQRCLDQITGKIIAPTTFVQHLKNNIVLDDLLRIPTIHGRLIYLHQIARIKNIKNIKPFLVSLLCEIINIPPPKLTSEMKNRLCYLNIIMTSDFRSDTKKNSINCYFLIWWLLMRIATTPQDINLIQFIYIPQQNTCKKLEQKIHTVLTQLSLRTDETGKIALALLNAPTIMQ